MPSPFAPALGRDSALEQLGTLLRIPGALRIITASPSPWVGTLEHGDPHRRVLHDVVRIEQASGFLPKGYVTAFSAEGDECSGPPLSVLLRLTEHATWRTSPLQAGDVAVNADCMVVSQKR